MRSIVKVSAALAACVVGLLFISLRAAVPSVPSNAWLATGDMSQPRAGAAGALLPNGYVLVTGGMSGAAIVATAERYSPNGGGFLDTPRMETARANHTATPLADGRVLVTGGTGADGLAVPSAEIYDPSVNGWTPVAPLNLARRGHTATLLPDGTVLIAGGDDGGTATDTLEIFDPLIGTFAYVDGRLSAPRTLHAAAALADGRVILVGGFDGTSPLNSTNIYDPRSGVMAAGPDLSIARGGLSATTLLDGKVLVAGGAGPAGEVASAQLYDPTANAFRPTANSLNAPRQNHLAFLLPHNNQVLIAGGTADGNPVASAELYTPWEGNGGTFCASAVCASGYAGPAPPSVARAWATGSALSFPASVTNRSGTGDGLLLLAGGTGEKSAELYGFATVKTDKDDYAPGTTVTIAGSGWQPNEWVALVLEESPNLDEHPLLDVQADGNGNIVSTEFVPDAHDVGVLFYLTAYGTSSQAQTTFTDDENLTSVSVGSQSPSGIVAGTQATYVVSVTFTKVGSNDTCTADLTVTGLTSGASGSFSPTSLTQTNGTATLPSTLTVTTTGSILTGTTSFTATATGRAGTSAGCAGVVRNGSGSLTVVPATTVSVSPASGTYGGSTGAITSTLTRTSDSTPVSGKTIVFTLNGGTVGTSVTDATGVATLASGSLLSPTKINAGTFGSGVKATFGGDTSFGSSSATNSLTVSPRAITVTAATNTKTYDATTSAAAVGTITAGTLVTGDTAPTWTETYDTKHVGPGKTLTPSGTVTDGNGGGNYLVTFAANTSGVITARPLTVTATNNLMKEYDGTAGSTTAPSITSGVLQGTDTAAFTQSYDTRHVGNGKTVTPAGTVADGNSGLNYTYSFVTKSNGGITARAITVTAATNSKGYDGTTSAAATPAITTGTLAPGDTASFTEAYANKNVGTGKTLTATGTVADGNSGNNYAVTFVNNTTGQITARAITVTAGTNSKGYDGTATAAATPAITTGTLASGDTAAFTEAYDTKNVGTNKVLTPAGSVSDGNSGNNYAVTFATNTTGQITARAITVTAATNSKGYDGTTSALATPTMTTGTLASGDTAVFTETYDNKNAGTGKTLTAAGTVTDGNGGGNYLVTFAANTTGVITAQALTVTATNNLMKQYDGTTASTTAPTITSGALQGTDTAAFTQSYDTKHVGNGKTVTPAGTVADGNSGLNYTYTFVTRTNCGITARPITVTAAANSKGYDGTTSAAATPAITIGTLATGDTASFTEAYANKNVGTGKTLTPAGSVSDGNSGNNYAVTFVNNSTGVITAQALTVTAAANTKAYDGTASAAATPTVTSGTIQTGDTANFSETYDTKHVGTGKALTAAGVVGDGNGGNNYTYTFVPNTTGVITARLITVTAATNTKIYDATTSAAAVGTITTGTVAAGDTAPTWTETYDTKHVGAGKTLTLSGTVTDGNGGGNYLVTFVSNTTGVITARALTVSATNNLTKEYDGTIGSTTAPSITSGVLQGTDTANFTQSYDTKHVGNGKTVTPAGTVADGNSGLNYTYTFVTRTNCGITARAITVAAASDTKGYDGTTSSVGVPTVTVGTLAPGDTASFSQTFDSKNAGARTLTAAGAVADGNSGNNYAVTFLTANGSITARAITVTPDAAQHKTYGDSDPPLTYTVTTGSLVGTDSFSGALTRAAGPHVGTYAINQGTLALSTNYLLTVASGVTFEILARAITVTPDAGQHKTYGENDPLALTYTVTIGTLVGGDTFSGALTRAPGTTVGTYAISQGTLALSTNYLLTVAPGVTFEIVARAITVTPDAGQHKTYGDSDPALTYTLTTGTLVGGDTFSGALTRTAGTTVGTYAISQGTLALSTNYLLTVAPGVTFEILARAITVTPDAGQHKTYGDSDPALTYSVTTGTLVGTDSFSGALTRSAGTTVGTYAISQGTLALSTNYLLTLAPGVTFEIVARAITVTPDAGQHKTYGDSDPALTYTVTAGTLVGGDTFSGALTRTAGTTVGTYAISQGTLALSTNYLLSVAPGVTFEIVARAITVTPDAGQHKTYGDSDPALTYTVTAGTLVGGDTFSGALTRTAGTTVGTYAISQGTLALSTNYLLSVAPGVTFEIVARAITVTPDAGQHKTYGDSDPALTYSVTTGTLVGTDSFSGALTRSAGTTVGTYAISQGTLALSTNYLLTVAPGVTFEIVARAITVTPDAGQHKTYGDSDPALTYTLTAGTLVSGDSFSGALTRTAGTTVGTYAISQGTLALSTNYLLTFAPGVTFEIVARAITVTPDAGQHKTYGDADPLALTYAVTTGSLVGTESFSGALARAAGTTVGTYAISQGTLALSTNYLLTVAPGVTFEIVARAITVTPDAGQHKTYGDSDPALTYTVTIGTLVGTDSFSGTLTRAPGTTVGTYAISQGTLALSTNYLLTLAPGVTFEIVARAITVTPDAGQHKAYGDSDPALTYSVTTGTLVGTDSFSGALARAAGTTVGTYAISQGTLALSTNYLLTVAPGVTFEILARAITVTPDSGQHKTYGDADPLALTYTVTTGSLVGTESFSGALARAAGTTVGTYAISQGTLALSTNYLLTVAPGVTFEIIARAITVTPDAGQHKTYGDSDPALTYSVTTGTLVGTDSFSGALTRTAGTTVGTYAISQGSLALSTNYLLTVAPGVTFEILARAITVTATTNTKHYDGAISAAAAPTITTGTLAPGQVGQFTETYDTKYVGSGKTLTPAGTVADASSADVTGNYHITFAASATGVINARILTVTGITANNKPYDGTTNATLDTTGAGLSGVVTGDIVTLNASGAVGSFVTSNVGVAKAVNINGLALGGVGAINYALPAPPPQATTTASITAWHLTGFYQPVTMTGPAGPPVSNLIKGGQTVPLKFNIYRFAGGPELTSVAAAVQQFSLAVISCTDGAPVADVDAFPTTGGTALRYDGTQFIQNWQSPKGANQCLVVTMKAQDGSMLSAYFKTK